MTLGNLLVPIPECDIFLKEELDYQLACRSTELHLGYLSVPVLESDIFGRFVQSVAMSADPQLTVFVG